MLNQKTIVQAASAAILLTGAAAVVQPGQADAAKSPQSYVSAAEKLAVKLSKEINYDARKKAHPKSPVGLPDEKLYKQTKSAYTQAAAQVKKVKNSKERKALQTRLSQKVKPVLDRTAKYKTAVQTGTKTAAAAKKLDTKTKAYKLTAAVKKEYTQLQKDSAKLTKQIKSVYGPSTRTALTKEYSAKTVKVLNTAGFAFDFKSDTEKLAGALKAENYSKAITYKKSIDQLIADNKKNKYASTTSTLYKRLYAAYKPVLADYNNLGQLVIAVSKKASSPTLAGGKTSAKPVSYSKNVSLAAGKDRYLKFRHANVNGTLSILGDNTGAGTVYVENVKVSKGKSIVVKNTAEHSLHLDTVSASNLTIEDKDGSHITAGADTKIDTLTTGTAAGGTISLESTAAGAFGTVKLQSEKANETKLTGDFSKTAISAEASGKITFTKGTTAGLLTLKAGAAIQAEAGVKINEITLDSSNKDEAITLSGDLSGTVIVIKSGASAIKVAPGTVIGEIQLDPSFKGSVNIDNQGTITKAAEGIIVKGNPPIEVVTPGTPGSPGAPGGGGGGTVPAPAAIDISRISTNLPGTNYEKDKVTLTGGKEDLLESITLKATEEKFSMKIVSITTDNNFVLPVGLTLTGKDYEAMASVADILPFADGKGIKLGILAKALDGGAFIKVELTDSKDNKVTKDVRLDLKNVEQAPTLENQWFSLTRAQTNGMEVVTATVKKPESKLSEVFPEIKKGDVKQLVDLFLMMASLDENKTKVGISDDDLTPKYYAAPYTGLIPELKQKLGNKAWGELTFSDLTKVSIYFKVENKEYQLKFNSK